MSDDAKALQEFGSSSHPGTIADFLGTLSPGEAWNILTLPGYRLRAEIFGHLSEELQIELAEELQCHDLAQIITYMPASDENKTPS